VQLQLLPNVSSSHVIDLRYERATCDFLDVKPGEWTLGLKLEQNPFPVLTT